MINEERLLKVLLAPNISEKSTMSAEEIMTYCRGRIADYKIVRSVDFTAEPLPRSPINKVLKRVLRDRYQTS